MKHRLVTLLVAFSLTPILLKGQSMESIFKLLPLECMELNGHQRDSLLRYREYVIPGGDSIETMKYDLSVDEINKYLRYELSFTTGQNGFTVWEVRKFKRKDGSSLILFSSYGGLLRSFDQHEIYAFGYQAKKLVRLKKQYLPKKININTFLEPNTPDSIKEKADNYCNCTYDLGPKAKDQITYSLYFQVIDEEVESYLRGDEISFIWTGEFFKQLKRVTRSGE